MVCFRLLLEHLAWIEHQFLSGIRDSRKPGSLWGMMRGVGGVRKSKHQIWLAKRLGLELLCWGFKGVQEEIPKEEASTFQIGSVAFPAGQCTSPQFHLCHRLFDQDGHQDSCSPSLYSRHHQRCTHTHTHTHTYKYSNLQSSLLRCGTRPNEWAPNETRTHSCRFANRYTTRGAHTHTHTHIYIYI